MPVMIRCQYEAVMIAATRLPGLLTAGRSAAHRSPRANIMSFTKDEGHSVQGVSAQVAMPISGRACKVVGSDLCSCKRLLNSSQIFSH